MDLPSLTFRRYDTVGGRAERDTVADVDRDAYAAAIAVDDPFETVDAFLERFDAYTSRDGFDLVVAYRADQPVGQAFGWPLRPPDGGWWRWLTTPVEPGLPTRTAAAPSLYRKSWFAGPGPAGHRPLPT